MRLSAFYRGRPFLWNSVTARDRTDANRKLRPVDRRAPQSRSATMALSRFLRPDGSSPGIVPLQQPHHERELLQPDPGARACRLAPDPVHEEIRARYLDRSDLCDSLEHP